MKVHHTGIIVKNILTEEPLYTALGYKREGVIITDTIQSNKLLFLTDAEGNNRIELIEPIGEKSSVARLPKGMAHICYEVNDINKAMDTIRSSKIGVVFTKVLVAPALDNRNIVFVCLHNKQIIEFVEAAANH